MLKMKRYPVFPWIVLPARRSRNGIFLTLTLFVTLTAGASAQALLIDDFTTGPYNVTLTAPGSVQNVQSGAMLGGRRCTAFTLVDNPRNQPGTLDIRGGYLTVDTGVRTSHRLGVLYGYDADCNAAPLNLDLRGFDRFRVEFDVVDLSLAGAVVVFTSSGSSSIPMGADPGLQFSLDLPFADFAGDADFSNVAQIAFVFQSAGIFLSHDYAITSIRAVSGP